MTEAGESSVRLQPRALIRVLLGALVLFAVTSAVSQAPQFEEFHTWTDVATIYNFSERFRYDGDYGLRGVLSDSEWDAGLRGRWQLQATSPRFAIGSAEEFYALASIEPFFEIGSSIVGSFGDRFRINLGLGRQFNEGLRVALNYLFHKIRLPDASG